ncbi:MAG: DUF2442 domain-containing protein [Rhodomicrobium sp.]
MAVSEAEFARANRRMARRRAIEPYAVAAEYDPSRRMIVVGLNNGTEVRFPADKLQGLPGATAEELADIEISPAGFDLHFPKLDADFSLPALLDGVFGSRKWMAEVLGAKGAKPAGKRKVMAARLGGRRKTARDDEHNTEE